MGMQLNFGDHSPKDLQLIAIPTTLRADAQWARSQANAIANTRPSANNYFRSLPAHRTLSSLLGDRSIWVSYNTGPTTGIRYALGGFNEIGIGYWGFRSKLTVLGTLIHELAHVGGAPDESFQAENALVYCGLGTLSELDTGIDDPSTPYIPRLKG